MCVIDDKLLLLCRVDNKFQLRRYDKNTSSIMNVFGNKKYTISPNPAKDMISIKADFLDKGSSVNIYNSFGVLVKTESLKGSQQTINIINLPSGIYVVEIKTNEWVDRQKIILVKYRQL